MSWALKTAWVLRAVVGNLRVEEERTRDSARAWEAAISTDFL